MESFKHIDAANTEQELDAISVKLGPYKNDIDFIYNKTRAAAHQEFGNVTREQLQDRLSNLQDPFDREGYLYEKTPIDMTYPKYFRENIDKFKKFININR